MGGAAKALCVRQKLAGAGIPISGISSKEMSQQNGWPKSTGNSEPLILKRLISICEISSLLYLHWLIES
jgi:hypothetical protein